MIRDTDLHELALKGSVRRVVTRVTKTGTILSEGNLDFDVTGQRVQPVRGGVTTIVGDDGSSTEIQVVAGAHSCCSPFVRDVAFDCQGAAIARTVIDRSGVPRHTAFEDDHGRLVSRIDYVSEPNGRVSAAVQRHVVWGGGGRPVPPEQSDVFEQLPEFVRLDISFTNEGDVKSVVTYMAGVRRSRDEYTYDPDRRMVSVLYVDEMSGEEKISKYQYLSTDEAGNWTTRTITLASGTLAESREITYY